MSNGRECDNDWSVCLTRVRLFQLFGEAISLARNQKASERKLLRRRAGELCSLQRKWSPSPQDAKSKQVKLSSPIHLPFETFEAMNLPFDLTLAPRQRARSTNRSHILLQTFCKTFQLGDPNLSCSSEPIVEFIGFASLEDGDEILAEVIGQGQLWTGLAELLDVSALLCIQVFFAHHARTRRLVATKFSHV